MTVAVEGAVATGATARIVKAPPSELTAIGVTLMMGFWTDRMLPKGNCTAGTPFTWVTAGVTSVLVDREDGKLVAVKDVATANAGEGPFTIKQNRSLSTHGSKLD